MGDIAGAKGLLKDAVAMLLLKPDYFRGISRSWKSVLMVGPSVAEKILLAKVIDPSTQSLTLSRVTLMVH